MKEDITDITQGNQKFQRVRGSDLPSEKPDKDLDDIKAFSKHMSQQSQAILHNNMAQTAGSDDVLDQGLYKMQKSGLDYGTNEHDSGILLAPDQRDIQNKRAFDQSSFEKIAYGIAKGSILAGTTFLDGTIGTIIGASEALAQGKFSRLWDNEFSNGMRAINAASEEWLKNNYSTEETDSPWESNIFTANFLGDQLLKNIGFTVGAGAASMSFLGGASKAVKVLKSMDKFKKAADFLNKSVKATKMIKTLSGSALAAINEGSIEAGNNSADWYKLEKQKLDDTYKQDYQRILDIYGNNPELAQPKLEHLNKTKEIADADLQKRRVKMGNLDLVLNFPLLMATETVQMGRMFAGGYKTARKSSNVAGRLARSGKLGLSKEATAVGKEAANEVTKLNKVLEEAKAALEKLPKTAKEEIKAAKEAVKIAKKNVKAASKNLGKNVLDNATYSNTNSKLKGFVKGLGSAVSEGTEEIMQSAASNVAGIYHDDKVHTLYENTLDPEANKKSIGFIKANAQGLSETLGKNDSWGEFFSGALSSFLGVPRFRNFRKTKVDAEGNVTKSWQSPIYTQGGPIEEYLEGKKAYEEDQELVDYLNNRVQDPKTNNYYKGLTINNKEQQKMEDALNSGSLLDFKDAEHSQMVSDIIMFDNAGKIDDLKAIIEMNSDLTDEDLDQIIKNTTKVNEDGTKSGPFILPGDGGNTILDSKDGANKMRKQIKDNNDTMLNTLYHYLDIKESIDLQTGEVLENEDLAELTWQKEKITNYEDRIKKLSDSNVQYNNKALAYHESLLSINKSILQEYLKNHGKLEKTTETKAQELSDAKTKKKGYRIIPKKSPDYVEPKKVYSEYEKTYMKDLEAATELNKKNIAAIKEYLDPNTIAGLIFKKTMESEKVNTYEEAVSAFINAKDTEESKVFMQDYKDIFSLQALKKAYEHNLQYYKNNPKSLRSERDRVMQKAIKDSQKEAEETLRESINNAKSIDELKEILGGNIDKKLKHKITKELLNNDTDKTSLLTKYYDIIHFYNAALSAIDKSKFSHIIKSKAKKIINIKFKYANSLDDMISLDDEAVVSVSSTKAKDDSEEVAEEEHAEAQSLIYKVIEDVSKWEAFAKILNTEKKDLAEVQKIAQNTSEDSDDDTIDSDIDESDFGKSILSGSADPEPKPEEPKPNPEKSEKPEPKPEKSEKPEKPEPKPEPEPEPKKPAPKPKPADDDSIDDDMDESDFGKSLLSGSADPEKPEKKPGKAKKEVKKNTNTDDDVEDVDYEDYEDDTDDDTDTTTIVKPTKEETPVETLIEKPIIIGAIEEEEVNKENTSLDNASDNEYTKYNKLAYHYHKDDSVSTTTQNLGTVPFIRPSISQWQWRSQLGGIPNYKPSWKSYLEQQPEGTTSWKDLYMYLEEKNAFSYVNEGNLKKGETIRFMMNNEWKLRKMQDINSLPIYMVTTSGQIVGTLPVISEKFEDSNTGLVNLIKALTKEYTEFKNKTTDINAEYTSPNFSVNVADIMVGSVQYGEKFRDVKTLMSKSMAEGKTPYIKVVKGIEFKSNAKNPKQLIPVQNIDNQGRIYLYLPNARLNFSDGSNSYTPTELRTKQLGIDISAKDIMSKSESTDDSIETKIYDLALDLAEAKDQEDVTKIKKELSKILYLNEDFHINMDITKKGKKTLRIYTIVRDDEGTIVKKPGIKDPNVLVAQRDSVSIVLQEAEFFGLSSAIVDAADDSEQLQLQTIKKEAAIEDVIPQIVNALVKFKLYGQVSAEEVTSDKYVRQLINSGVLVTRAVNPVVQNSWFITNYYDGKLNKQETEMVSYYSDDKKGKVLKPEQSDKKEKNIPVVKEVISQSVDNTIPVAFHGGSKTITNYKVDLESNTIYNEDSKEMTDLSDSALIIALARIKKNFHNRASLNIQEGLVKLEDLNSPTLYINIDKQIIYTETEGEAIIKKAEKTKKLKKSPAKKKAKQNIVQQDLFKDFKPESTDTTKEVVPTAKETKKVEQPLKKETKKETKKEDTIKKEDTDTLYIDRSQDPAFQIPRSTEYTVEPYYYYDSGTKSITKGEAVNLGPYFNKITKKGRFKTERLLLRYTNVNRDIYITKILIQGLPRYVFGMKEGSIIKSFPEVITADIEDPLAAAEFMKINLDSANATKNGIKDRKTVHVINSINNAIAKGKIVPTLLRGKSKQDLEKAFEALNKPEPKKSEPKEPTRSKKPTRPRRKQTNIAQNIIDSTLDFDIDAPISPRKYDASNNTLWNKEQELAWLNKVLPQLSTEDKLKFTKGLITVGKKDAKAWGTFNNGMITLSNRAARGTTYHEAFHAVFSMYVTAQEKELILREARSYRGNLSDVLLEEFLAEDFRKYTEHEISKNIGTKIMNFFKDLLFKITHWNSVQKHSIALFKNINNGYYADKANLVHNKEQSSFKTLEDLKYDFDSTYQSTNNFEFLTPRDKSALLSRGFSASSFNSRSYKEKANSLYCL